MKTQKVSLIELGEDPTLDDVREAINQILDTWHDWEKAISESPHRGFHVWQSESPGGPGEKRLALAGDFIGRFETGGFFVLKGSRACMKGNKL